MANQIAALLKGIELFSALDEDQLVSIASLARERKFKKGEKMIQEEESDCQALYLIVEGEATVSILLSEGREVILSLLTKGDFFGEMSLLDGEPRSASVRAERDSLVVMIRRNDLLDLLRKMPDLSLSLLEQLSKRLRRANRQIGSLATLSALGRVADVLLHLIEERGVRIPHPDYGSIVMIKGMPSRQQLAEMSATTRESVSRSLSELKRRGVIAINGRDLVIINEKLLQNEV